MALRSFILITAPVLFLSFLRCDAQREAAEEQAWSQRIAGSFLAMHPDSIIYPDVPKSRRWNYEQGLVLEALYQMWALTGDSTYVRYVKQNLDYYILPDGTIRTYRLEDFNIDNIAPGKVTVRIYQMTGEEKYRLAADILREQLRRHPRTKSGGFWHKKIYPYQMWLDGLYMGEPFYTLYATEFGEREAFDEIALQFLLIEKNNRDSASGLYYHGWDESRSERWADPLTGRSANFWGRSIGWLAMALVDVLEYFPQNHPRRPDLERIFRNLAESVLPYRDETTGLWYQVVDRPTAEGNYREASASAMLAYALAKGTRLGYLGAETGRKARQTFQGILEHLVTIDQNGLLHLQDVCSVAGLGGKPYRDGSYAYYIREPKRTDDFKGYGPFLLAAIETERLASGTGASANTKEE